MEFRILGPLEVLDDGRILDVGGAKQRALLAVLLLDANRTVSTDQLIDALWGEQASGTALKTLQVHVSQLRKTLGKDRIVTAGPGYQIQVEPQELDLGRFQAFVSEGKLAEALSIWRGQPLADFMYEPFAQAEIARLEELRLATLEDRIDDDLARGRHKDLVGELETLVGEHPLRERLQGQLMIALYRSGRQAEALERYREARRDLAEQLGIEPGPALRELERQILNHDESLAPRRAPLAALGGRRRSLIALVAAAIVLAMLVALTAVLTTRDSAGGLSEVEPNQVGVIDPKTNTVTDAIPVGIRPGPVSAGAGSVWVGNLGDRNLTKIDPRRRSAIRAVSLGDRTPTGLAVGSGEVWVAHGLRGQLSRVEPQFNRLARTIPVTNRSSTGSVAVGARSVWVAYGDSTLARVRTNTMRVDGSALAGSIPAGVVVGGGSVWLANFGDATVQRFDPVTFEEGPVRTITVGRRPSGIAFGEGAVWVANRGDDSITRIDPSTSSAGITVPVGDEPVAVAAGAGAVWVSNAGDGTVSRIDPSSSEVVSIDVGGTPAGIAVTDGLVFVAVQAARAT